MVKKKREAAVVEEPVEEQREPSKKKKKVKQVADEDVTAAAAEEEAVATPRKKGKGGKKAKAAEEFAEADDASASEIRPRKAKRKAAPEAAEPTVVEAPAAKLGKKSKRRGDAEEAAAEEPAEPVKSGKGKKKKKARASEDPAGDNGGVTVDPGEKPGDWICPGCGFNVFASKETCFKCGSNKAGEGAKPKVERSAGDALEIFVKNLSSHTDEESFREHFASCGKIRELTLPLRSTGKSKGFGWIIFKKQDGLDAALELNGSELKGFKIVVEKARMHKSDGKGGKGKGKGKGKAKGGGHEIFVNNLSYETTEDGLKTFFAECGKIERMHMPTKGGAKCMGFAWITFAEKTAFETAVDRNGVEFDGRRIRVEKSGQHKKKDDAEGAAGE